VKCIFPFTFPLTNRVDPKDVDAKMFKRHIGSGGAFPTFAPRALRSIMLAALLLIGLIGSTRAAENGLVSAQSLFIKYECCSQLYASTQARTPQMGWVRL
jgi:hypothetical protein